MPKHCMSTWFTPTSSCGRAAGISTFHSICHRVQPEVSPASSTSVGTVCRPSSVSRAIGGMANRIVAMAPASSPMPMNTEIGSR